MASEARFRCACQTEMSTSGKQSSMYCVSVLHDCHPWHLVPQLQRLHHLQKSRACVTKIFIEMQDWLAACAAACLLIIGQITTQVLSRLVLEQQCPAQGKCAHATQKGTGRGNRHWPSKRGRSVPMMKTLLKRVNKALHLASEARGGPI